MKEQLARRDFLKISVVLFGGALAGCVFQTQEPTEAKTPVASNTPELTKVPTGTETPEPTPQPPKPPSISELMAEAREAGLEVFSVQDPNGVEVVVDVVPQEVVEEEWSWELRGFTKEVEGQLQVWRTLKGREKDLSQWFDVVSSLEVPGYGTLTIELDREAMAKKGLTEIYLQNPQDWKTVLDIFWGEKQTALIAEPSDYGLIHEKIIERKVIPFEIYSFEKLTRNAGASFVMVPEFDESFNRAEKWRLQTGETVTGVVFKNTAQAGRPVLVMYFATWKDGRNLESSNLGFYGSADLGWFVSQGRQEGVEAMIREDRNPWKQFPSGKQPYKIQKAWEAIAIQGPDEKWYTKLVGPHP